MAEKKKILLRLSPELWEELNRWAADELRSVNSQVEYALREAVRTRRRVATRGDDEPDPGRSGGA